MYIYAASCISGVIVFIDDFILSTHSENYFAPISEICSNEKSSVDLKKSGKDSCSLAISSEVSRPYVRKVSNAPVTEEIFDSYCSAIF